ncbi:MAG: chemotaxis-specific protein-glutamate methyltransferase CheB [Algiphilus sp.]|uniref:chemotaxis-specific protein-glutamate methyltransferase CheB n=1 Tax=Algiphilus sp. TaxID=1872431 RepID=UPI0032FE84B2
MVRSIDSMVSQRARQERRVLLVHESAQVRASIRRILAEEAAVSVVDEAPDAYTAWERMRLCWPDLVILDVAMQHMDGMSFLRQIMRKRPTPVVICSAFTERNKQLALEALSHGAIAMIYRPAALDVGLGDPQAEDLRRTVRECLEVDAARARRVQRQPANRSDRALPRRGRQSAAVVGIGISTGGPRTLATLLREIALPVPPIVIVQHMPQGFTGPLAERLDRITPLTVQEAVDGMTLRSNHVYIAPAGRHTRLRRRAGDRIAFVIEPGERVRHHMPSVDVLFDSMADQLHARAVGVLMTGMGDDGARGIERLHQRGAVTMVQDEASCVVFGMPKAALARHPRCPTLSVGEIATYLSQLRRYEREALREAG